MRASASASIQFFERDGQGGIVEHGLDASKTLGVAPNGLLGLGELWRGRRRCLCGANGSGPPED